MASAVAQTRLKPRVPAACLPLPSVGRGAGTMGGTYRRQRLSHGSPSTGRGSHGGPRQQPSARSRSSPRPDPSGPPSGVATCVDPPERRGSHAGHRVVHERRPVAQESDPPELAGQVHTVASEDAHHRPSGGKAASRGDVLPGRRAGPGEGDVGGDVDPDHRAMEPSRSTSRRPA